MITYDVIAKANESINKTEIKGKPYAEVFQRVNAFRMVYPQGTIETTMMDYGNGVCVIQATVKDGDRVLATGTAYEKEGSSYINKTSYIENCETSAVGRALGMAGFGIDTSMSSFEEVANAIVQQEVHQKIDKISKSCYKEGKPNDDAVNFVQAFLDENNTEKLKDLTADLATVLLYLMTKAGYCEG